MNSKTIICFIFSIMTVFLKLCAAEKIKVCRKIFVYKQKAIESWSTDDLCFLHVYNFSIVKNLKYGLLK